MPSLEFRNKNIFITGISRQKAELPQIKSLQEYGIVTSDEINRDENMYGTFTEDTVWNQFYELIGEKYIKKELKILQEKMKSTSQWTKSDQK